MVKPSIKNNCFILLCIFAFCLVLSGCNDSRNPGIIIKDAHLYMPLEGSDMAAGYLRLENHQLKKINISSIECKKVKASLHETAIDLEGMIKMKKLELFSVGPESHVNFIPGGMHIMFSGLKEFKESILMCAFLSTSGIEIPFVFEVRTNEK